LLVAAFLVLPASVVVPAATAGASCAALGNADWVGVYTLTGQPASSAQWVTVHLDESGGTLSGSITSLNGNPVSGTSTTGTYDANACVVQGTTTGLPGADPINFQGAVSGDASQIDSGLWSAPSQGLSGSFSLARALHSVSTPSDTSLTTDPGTGATPADPIQVSVSSPTAQPILIQTGSTTNPPVPGYQLLDQLVHIETPPAQPGSYLTLEFVLDGSVLAQFGASAGNISVFRNGVELKPHPGCTGQTPTLPCISGPETVVPGTNPGDVKITVFTNSASIWSFGLPLSYISPYSNDEGKSLYIDAVFLHSGDVGAIQKTATQFMVYLGGLSQANPPTLGEDIPSTTDFTVTSNYDETEALQVRGASTLFGTYPENLQRIGVKLLAFLIVLSR
jgi:hypothetical protein